MNRVPRGDNLDLCLQVTLVHGGAVGTATPKQPKINLLRYVPPPPLRKHGRGPRSQAKLDHKNSGPKNSSKRRFNAHPSLRQGRACARGGG